MAKDTKQRQAAKAFIEEWTGKGYEKGETQRPKREVRFRPTLRK